jgi:GNAT superfamily N-acetyltransferase
MLGQACVLGRSVPRMPLAAPYTLVEGPPDVDAYLELRAEAGLTPRTRAQAEAALRGSWAAVHALDEHGSAVGMARVIGDGGWYFHVVDMAVRPAHQRRGIGDAILERLLQRIHELAPPDAYVSLLADEPGRRLYERHGFRPTAPRSIGMAIPSGAPSSGALRPAQG